MPRRRSKKNNSLLNDELFVLVLVAAIALIILPWVWRLVMGGMAILAALIYIYIYRVRIGRLRKAGVDLIDRMDGKAFEERLWLLFRDLGYAVEVTPYRGDWGADLIISKDGKRTVVQAKRYAKPVGITAIQEAVAAQAKYRCSGSMVVTNSTFTAQARELAGHNNTELWDREKLLKALLET